MVFLKNISTSQRRSLMACGRCPKTESLASHHPIRRARASLVLAIQSFQESLRVHTLVRVPERSRIFEVSLAGSKARNHAGSSWDSSASPPGILRHISSKTTSPLCRFFLAPKRRRWCAVRLTAPRSRLLTCPSALPGTISSGQVIGEGVLLGILDRCGNPVGAKRCFSVLRPGQVSGRAGEMGAGADWGEPDEAPVD